MDFSKVLLLSASVVVSVACNQPPTSESKGVPTAAAATATVAPKAGAGDAADTARTYFKQKCVVCHGDQGAGDGPGAAALNPKPRAFALAEWQASVTDEQIGKTIVLGGVAVGKDAAMPPNPDLASKKEVVAELVKIVRAFKK